jgi:hypothetical protein
VPTQGWLARDLRLTTNPDDWDEFSMTDLEKLAAIKACIQEWNDKSGHDRCWYYPDIFQKIATIAGVTLSQQAVLPTRKEFEQYQDDQFGLQPTVPVVEYVARKD